MRALDRLRALENSENGAGSALTKPPEGAFVSSVSSGCGTSGYIRRPQARAELLDADASACHEGAKDPAPEVPLEPRAAARRRRVLAFLDAHQNVQRAVRTDVGAEPGKVTVTIGLRRVGTGEVEIPAERYDAGALMALLDKYAAGVTVDGYQVSTEQFSERSST